MAGPQTTVASRYTKTAIALHWIVFVLVTGGWIFGHYVSDLPLSPQKLKYVSYHKWIGVTIFMVVLVRLVWRWHRPAPPLDASMPAFQRRAAFAVHVVLYVLLLVIPLTGWLYSSARGVPTVWLGLIQLPDLLGKDKAFADMLRGVHFTLNWVLAALVAGHTAFALKHHFVDRDGVLARMIPMLKVRTR